MYFRRILFALAAVVLPRAVSGQTWNLTTADFKSEPVAVKSMADDGVHIVPDGSTDEKVVPYDQFVSMQRGGVEAAASGAKFTLVLNGGDRLVGSPESVKNEKLAWNNVSLGTVSIPLSKLRAMVARTVDAALPDDAPLKDVATLVNGDTLSGVFTDCTDTNLTLQTDNGHSTVPLSSVSRVLFAATPGAPATAPAGLSFKLHLADGSVMTAASLKMNSDKLSLAIAGAASVELPLDQVQAIEQLNGPVTWVSSLTPKDNVQVPYIGGSQPWPAKFDRAVDGSPLQFDGRIFEHGIGVHAYSQLSFAVAPGFKSFRTQYAIDSHRDHPAVLADVTVRIKVDGKVVVEQQHVKAGTLSPVVQVDLKDAEILTLEVDFGASHDTQARLNWLNPAMLK